MPALPPPAGAGHAWTEGQLLLLPRRELQDIAKALGLKANSKSADLAKQIVEARPASASESSGELSTTSSYSSSHQSEQSSSRLKQYASQSSFGSSRTPGKAAIQGPTSFDLDSSAEVDSLSARGGITFESDAAGGPRENFSRQLNVPSVMDLFPKVRAALLPSGPAKRVPVTPPVRTPSKPSLATTPKTPRTPAVLSSAYGSKTPSSHSLGHTPKTPATANREAKPATLSTEQRLKQPPLVISAAASLQPTSALKQALIDERVRRRSLHAQLQNPPQQQPQEGVSLEHEDLQRELLSMHWERTESRSKPGRFYFFNTLTKETRWTLPTAT